MGISKLLFKDCAWILLLLNCIEDKQSSSMWLKNFIWWFLFYFRLEFKFCVFRGQWDISSILFKKRCLCFRCLYSIKARYVVLGVEDQFRPEFKFEGQSCRFYNVHWDISKSLFKNCVFIMFFLKCIEDKHFRYTRGKQFHLVLF